MKRPKASRRVGSVGVAGMTAAQRTDVALRMAAAEEIAGECSELQSRQWLLELFDNGLDNGALGNASSWKWFTSALVTINIIAAQRTTNHVFQRRTIRRASAVYRPIQV